ncbi:MAG: hypothetical protein JST54_33750 [Deltaproteobacteria bacterium]|nr:hypothetical protein [Deltaproteobacteria bacterium]
MLNKLLSAALAVVLAVAPGASAFAQAGSGAAPSVASIKNPFLKAGIRLYNELEFASALEQLKKAESYPGNSVGEDVLVHVYEGIVQYESNNKDGAETEFKTALALNIKAQLPKNVSPKISALFEKVRTELAKEVEVVAPPPADVPKADNTPSNSSNTNASNAITQQVKPAPPGPPVAPWIALGVGVAAAGAGGYFALHARSLSNQAQTDAFQSDADAALSGAKTSATISYASFGVAAVAVATFATLFILSGGDDSSGASGDVKPQSH